MIRAHSAHDRARMLQTPTADELGGAIRRELARHGLSGGIRRYDIALEPHGRVIVTLELLLTGTTILFANRQVQKLASGAPPT